MRIQVMSDLHFEFHRDLGANFIKEVFVDKVNVLVIAGDLAHFSLLQESIINLCKRCEHMLIMFVPGNHEFYNSDLLKTLSLLTMCSKTIRNFKCLYNNKFVYHGVTFFGTTLWFPHKVGMESLYGKINDFCCISKFAEQIYSENKTAVDFIHHADVENSIVITHYMPSWKSVHPNFKDSVLNPFFVCDLEDVIIKKKPKYWIHGHGHKSMDYTLGKTRIICNPLGYVYRDQNLDFDYNLILEV